MSAPIPPRLLDQDPPPPPPSPHRRLRWILTALAVLLLLIVTAVAAIAITITRQPTPAPLTLSEPSAAPAGPLDGTWTPSAGSVAGFRIQQTVLGLTSDIVGRTADVTGTVAIADGQVTRADIRINLLTLTSAGKPAPQFAASLDTQRYPAAALTLARPVALGATFVSGGTSTLTATVRLTLHGVTRTVAVQLSARRHATVVEVAGSIPVSFSDWGISQPQGFGGLGSLADHGVAELLVILQHS